MYEYHDQYKRAWDRSDIDAQARWARQLTWEIARHAVGEEIVVYPLMEQHLGEQGKKLADHDREEHQVRYCHSMTHRSDVYARVLQSVKEQLYKLESLQPGSAEYHTLITTIMESLHHHNDDEEIKDLPLLEPIIGEQASKDAALSFKKTKKIVPTRSVFP